LSRKKPSAKHQDEQEKILKISPILPTSHIQKEDWDRMKRINRIKIILK